MRGRDISVAALLAVMVVLTAVPLASGPADAPPADNEEPEPTSVVLTAYGYVTNLSDQEENTPLKDVNVGLFMLSNGVKVPVETVEVDGEDGPNPTLTDSDGRFEFTFEYFFGSTYFLSFDYPGYTVRSLPDLSMEMDDDGFVQFEIRPDMVDENGDYALTGTADGLHAIVMVITTGSVYGTVSGTSGDGEFALDGARVTIVSANGQSYSTLTNDQGYFQIECPFGTYTMTVTCSGFGDSERIEVESGANVPYTVTLDQNTSQAIFGLDIAHSTMVIGLVVLVLMVVLTAAIYMRQKRSSETILMNDLDTIGKEEEDEVRRP